MIYYVAIVEDNLSSAEQLTRFLDKYANENSISIRVTHYKDAETFLENYKSIYELIFMDIELGGINGIDAVKKLRVFDPYVLVMFVTNMPQYALKGYEVDALDYVVKPINYNSFSVKISKAIGILARRSGYPLRVRVEDGFMVVMSSEVSYIEVMDHDVYYHTLSGSIKAYGNLSEREKQLQKYNFARCSACVLVNLKYVKGLYGDDVDVDGARVKISRSKKKDFLKRLNEYLGGM